MASEYCVKTTNDLLRKLHVTFPLAIVSEKFDATCWNFEVDDDSVDDFIAACENLNIDDVELV